MNGQLRSVLVIFIALLVWGKAARAQGWERVYNQFPLKGEVLRAVLPTADDGLLVLGVSGSDAPEGPRSYLQKVDADGEIQWTRDVYADTFGHEAWKMVRQASGRLAILSAEKAPGNVVPTYWVYTCDEDGSNGSGPHLLVATAEAKRAWDIAPRIGGGSVVTGRYKITSSLSLAYIQVLSDLGVGQQSFPIPGSDSLALVSVASLEDGGFVAAGYFREAGDEDPYLVRLNSAGSKVWDFRLNDPPTGSPDTIAFHEVAAAPDGGFWVVGSKNLLNGWTRDSFFVQKFSPAGQPLWKKTFADHLSYLEFGGFDRSKILPTADGGLTILYETYHDGPGKGGEDLNLTKLDASGNTVWTRRYGREKRWNESPFDFCQTSNGFAVASWLNDTVFFSNDGYLLRTDAQGLISTNHVQGRVVFDQNLDCAANPGEKKLVGWQVQVLRQGQLVGTALTDFDGHFSIDADTGQLVLKAVAPNAAWELCLPSQSVNFTQPFDTATVDFLSQPASDCPVLEADISTLLLRRCFDSQYTITWANRGTMDVPGATLQVELDPHLSFVAADHPLANQSGQTLFFNLGDLGIGDFGQIHLTVHVDCDSTVIGQAHCSTVKILPDVLCLPSSNWSGAHIEVEGDCQPDGIHFKVKNTGTGTTVEPVGYIIIEDELLLNVGHVNTLGPAQDTTLVIPANGLTFRIEAESEPNDPNSFSNPTVAIEGCGADTSGTFSTGYITIFPNDDGDPTADTDCRTNQSSFDPNRKDGFPTGYGEGNFILPTTEIEYLIQFQNTGTDTAFSVAIRDTLDPWLDVSTVKLGASSHPCDLEIRGKNVLKFTFSPIALPDSNVNEAESHGFVAFRVRPKPDVPLKTLIENRAAIFFDFNAPVITNQTFHRIDTGFIQHKPTVRAIEPKSALFKLKISPNPASRFALIEGPGVLKNRAGTIRLRSVLGEVLREEKVFGKRLPVHRGGVPSGIYQVEWLDGGRVVAFGRLVFL